MEPVPLRTRPGRFQAVAAAKSAHQGRTWCVREQFAFPPRSWLGTMFRAAGSADKKKVLNREKARQQDDRVCPRSRPQARLSACPAAAEPAGDEAEGPGVREGRPRSPRGRGTPQADGQRLPLPCSQAVRANSPQEREMGGVCVGGVSDEPAALCPTPASVFPVGPACLLSLPDGWK